MDKFQRLCYKKEASTGSKQTAMRKEVWVYQKPRGRALLAREARRFPVQIMGGNRTALTLGLS
jgi:hypothetical protein